MNIDEYNLVKTLTYLDYCDYLQSKYGIGTENYFLENYKKNYACSRTKEGLFCHHKREDACILLNDPWFAQACPYEWQYAENLVYCDYLEHLLLHYLIVKYPSNDILSLEEILVSNGLEDSSILNDEQHKFSVGIGGVKLISEELEPYIERLKFPQKAWELCCWLKVSGDENVYYEINKDFGYLFENFD